jgi:hypothetical protein
VPISAFIFLGGRADFQVVVTWTGLATACYILVLPAAAMECVLMQGFFADRKMISVTLIGVLASLLSVAVSLVFIVLLKVEATVALVVISLGFVASRCLKSVALAVYLRRSVPMFPLGETLSFACRIALVGAVVALATYGTGRGVSRVFPDGLDRARATYEAATAGSGTTTVAGVHQLLGNRLDAVVEPERRAKRLEIMRALAAALRDGDGDARLQQRERLLALVPAGTAAAEWLAVEEATRHFEDVIAANAAVSRQVSRFRVLVKLAVASLAGLLAFLGSAYVLRVKEPFDMVSWSLGKVLRKAGRARPPATPLAE